MSVEVITENIQILNLKRKLKKAEEEVTQIKAKLYDQSQSTPSQPTSFLLEELITILFDLFSK